MTLEIVFLLAHATPDHDLRFCVTPFQMFKETQTGWFCTYEDRMSHPTFVKKTSIGQVRDYRKDREAGMWSTRDRQEADLSTLEAHMRKHYKRKEFGELQL